MDHDIPRICTQRLLLFVPGPQDADRCVQFNRDNAAFLAPWEPTIAPRAFDLDAQREAREHAVKAARQGAAYNFAFILGDTDRGGPLVGWCTLSNVVRGVFQAAHLGYKLDERRQGNGYMTEAIEGLLGFAFETLLLHRVMANYMPHNQRSANVLRRLGFTVEGSARSYLYIAGQWRDHVLTSKLNPSPQPPSGY